MFVSGRPWLQVLIFMAQNLVSLIFFVTVMPNLSKVQNYLNIFNESVSLIVSYLIIQINDLRYEPGQQTYMGELIVNIIYFSWACNLISIILVILVEIWHKLKVKYYTKLIKKFPCLRPKKKKKRVLLKRQLRTELLKYGRSSIIRSCSLPPTAPR